jgi:hypothetical protein
MSEYSLGVGKRKKPDTVYGGSGNGQRQKTFMLFDTIADLCSDVAKY